MVHTRQSAAAEASPPASRTRTLRPRAADSFVASVNKETQRAPEPTNTHYTRSHDRAVLDTAQRDESKQEKTRANKKRARQYRHAVTDEPADGASIDAHNDVNAVADAAADADIDDVDAPPEETSLSELRASTLSSRSSALRSAAAVEADARRRRTALVAGKQQHAQRNRKAPANTARSDGDGDADVDTVRAQSVFAESSHRRVLSDDNLYDFINENAAAATKRKRTRTYSQRGPFTIIARPTLPPSLPGIALIPIRSSALAFRRAMLHAERFNRKNSQTKANKPNATNNKFATAKPR